jgi:hypothetical protein
MAPHGDGERIISTGWLELSTESSKHTHTQPYLPIPHTFLPPLTTGSDTLELTDPRGEEEVSPVGADDFEELGLRDLR